MNTTRSYCTRLALRAFAISLLCPLFHATEGWAQALNNQGAPSHSHANPWGPAATALALPQGGTPMTFKSNVEGGGNLLIPGVLYEPAGATRGAVVIVNGSYGWSNSREGHYARSMSSAGFAVLVIDTYAPRGVTNTGTDTSAVSMFDQLGDAYAARRALIEAGYRPDRIAIMGAGRGGAIALMAADRAFGPPEGDRSFALAMAVTPSCLLRPRAPKPLAVVFVGLAEKDSLNGVQACQEIVAEFAAAGGKVASKVYPGTASGFDGEPIITRMVRDPRVENLQTCKVVVEPDGRSTFEGKSFSKAEFSALVAQMRRSCVVRGAFGYTNLTQKANVTLDLIDFLDANFAQ